jgi:hypothetical protein
MCAALAVMLNLFVRRWLADWQSKSSITVAVEPPTNKEQINERQIHRRNCKTGQGGRNA